MRVHLQQNASVENGGPYRLALFEHITSPTALVLPIEELIHLCRKYGILSLVDGAHGIGQVDLKLDALKPDFYVTNTHKWLCHSRGCAILYISSEHHSKIKPLITSWGANQGLHAEFIWQGTADYAPYLSLPVTIKLFNWLSSNDLSSLYSRNCTLAQRAGNMLSHVWGTSLLSLDPDMFAAMVSVAVPVRQAMSAIDCGEEACGISDLHDDLINKFSIEVPVFTFKGRKYIRVSIHVYNCWDDVLKLASAVLNALGYQLGSDAFNRLQDYIREEDGTVDGENE
ncbi:pyridoxal phosphate-dependent transferase [Obelidium mucronatum]|nr:pyridoxal phosphate-dependent transferase [Obelidium mucronatum]